MKYLMIFATAVLTIAVAIQISNIQDNMQDTIKKVNVWDTYVTKTNGEVMHFDIIAPVEIRDTNVIYKYGKDYLKTKGQEGQPLTAVQCSLCHMEEVRPSWQDEIDDKGYFIIEMEGCDK